MVRDTPDQITRKMHLPSSEEIDNLQPSEALAFLKFLVEKDFEKNAGCHSNIEFYLREGVSNRPFKTNVLYCNQKFDKETMCGSHCHIPRQGV
jgi:hypothetical protein